MALYREVVDLHFDDITGDDALWMLADLTHNRLSDLATAQDGLRTTVVRLPWIAACRRGTQTVQRLAGD